MLNIDYSTCVGCGACFSICPVNAIKMEKNDRGFLYPIINEEICIKCDMCNNICLCNEKDNGKIKNDKIRFYIASHKNKKTHYKSQSGGISYALGEKVIKSGGIVYGCIYNEKHVAMHVRIDTIEDLEKTRGSKYVQSDLCNTYQEVYEDLKERIVLFTGTPCQIEGLYKFLQIKKSPLNNLYTVDIICHGVPSPLILEKFLEYIEKKNNSKVKELNLRNKNFAPSIVTTILLENGITRQCNFYSELFYTNICLREACGTCSFATINRKSDITMGDIKGLSLKYASKVDHSNPPSIVIVHSHKGSKLVENSEIDKLEIGLNEFDQPNLHRASKVSPQKERFWNDFKKEGFEFILKKYTSAGGLKTKLKRRVMQKFNKW